jgi:hypothetical protein
MKLTQEGTSASWCNSLRILHLPSTGHNHLRYHTHQLHMSRFDLYDCYDLILASPSTGEFAITNSSSRRLTRYTTFISFFISRDLSFGYILTEALYYLFITRQSPFTAANISFQRARYPVCMHGSLVQDDGVRGREINNLEITLQHGIQQSRKGKVYDLWSAI